ncbi:MAG: response regulator [Burkholderiales bacterium]|nr:response regulator [Burkholderiales bacterium]
MRLNWFKCLRQVPALASLWMMSLCMGTAHASPDSSIVIKQATLARGLCSEHHAETPIQLPDDWAEHHLKSPAVACYRAKIFMDHSPTIPWALRIDRLPGNHRITVNGVQLTTRHMDGTDVTSMATLPYLIELPVNVLLAGDNDVEIDVRMNPFRKPGISPMEAAPIEPMRADFDRWVALTVDLPKTLNLSVAGMALFLLLAWRARPAEKVFAYFGGLMVVMCLRNAFYFLETISWPTPLVDWLFFASHAVSTYYMLAFGLSYAGVKLDRIIWPMRAVTLAVPLLALMAMGTPYLDMVRLVAFPLMMLTGVLVVGQLLQTAWKRHLLEAVAMTAGPVATFISVAHDYLFLTSYVQVTDLYWTPYCTPVIFLGYALTLMHKFVDTMNLSERMNITLEERVAERTHALEVANESKTRFLASASHDLRQPTAAIGLLVSLLRQQKVAPEVKELTNMLDEAVTSMESLLVGLLDMSRLDAGAVQVQFQPVCLNDVFKAVRVHEESAANAKGLSLRFRFPANAGPHLMVLTDPVLIHGVVRNLVANAIRYTQRGGVLVAVRRRGKRRLRIEIWDTGIGIATDQQERIFDEFYQVGNASRDRSGGIGLGLAIVRRTALLLGEQVTVKSRVGRGSCFAIELPLNHVKTTKPVVSALPSKPLVGHNVWVVEDDVLLRRTLGEMLKSWGANTRTWPDGESLLDDLPQLLANSDQQPNLLISDYRLPGINGLQLGQTIQAYLRDSGMTLHTMIISGDTDPAEIARLSNSGLPVMAKPFRSEHLLKQLLALPKTRAASPV